MTKFNQFSRSDQSELMQRIAYFESLNKERQVDFIINDYFIARMDNEAFDEKKAHTAKLAEYEKGRQLREYEHRLELAENSDARAEQNEWHKRERANSDAAFKERCARYAADRYWELRKFNFDHWAIHFR